ncbi:hypothetical protein H0G86_008069 [Trichoderma simmonsii]|uniref:Uncharacterized protein n=1 Tax=Trichoderma simmonsii TaxID=1491479 RepID=A0A8G0PHR6_9HYPO|nr:hypothetical protein H0G86_008069 [Trichoderma simmonsii]
MEFSDLPERVRYDIYKRVLVIAHPIYLFQDNGSRVETFSPDIPIRWLALLHSNGQIYREARAVLYSMNRFTLVDTTQQQAGLLQSFLDSIGSVNANLLSHLCINFPVVENRKGQSCGVELREDGRQSLKLLQEKCASLKTLETFVHGNNSSFLTETCEGNSQFVREALLRVDAQLKTISSLKQIIVRVYARNLTSSVMDMMRGLGWVVVLGDR